MLNLRSLFRRPADSLPSWFRADEVFVKMGQWYFGSSQGLHIGPYANQGDAQARGQAIAKRLRALKTDQDRLNFVRSVLDEEWDNVRERFDETGEAGHAALPAATEAVRSGERPKNWYRSGRLFQVDGVWFFATREGIDVGPFDSEREAKNHERRLVALLIQANTEHEAYKVIHEYKHRPAGTYRSTTRTQFAQLR